MPGAFADDSAGCTTGLQNCSLLKALWFRFAWLLYNFPDPLEVVVEWWVGTRTVFPPLPPLSLLSGLGGASKLSAWEKLGMFLAVGSPSPAVLDSVRC